MTNNITDPTGTRRARRLAEMGYSTREIEEEMEHSATGSHFANALAFIVETLASDEELPVQNTDDFENNLDVDTMLEFAEMYNFTMEAFHKALEMFRNAVDTEVHNAFYNGDCHNCMENPPQFN